MNGILVVDKPAGFTSFDVVAKMRGICGVRKIGHAGTLDPMATGVLPVFIGPAVKAVDLQLNHDKTYEAVLLFGRRTDTGDITGEVLEQCDQIVDETSLQEVLPRFTGPQQQLPPMYSAVKVAGKPLYRYAREGKQVERKLRSIHIYSIDYLGKEGENLYKISVHCSKGTYIRTLAEDIGTALGLPATLAGLRRTVSGVFTQQEAHSLEEIQQARINGTLEALLVPVQRVFEGLPVLQLEEEAVQRLLNGAPVYNCPAAASRYAGYAEKTFIGIVQVDEQRIVSAEKLFCRQLK